MSDITNDLTSGTRHEKEEVDLDQVAPVDLSSIEDDDYDAPDIPCKFVTGPAGCGKTTWVRKQIAEDKYFGVLAATTGIAAVNLDTITLNSLLKYFDTDSLEQAYIQGRLHARLVELSKLKYRNLIIDEVSMLDGRQLDFIYKALGEVNERDSVKQPLGLIVTGDFCQLPPVKAPFAFEAECWPKFEANTLRLEKIWRQSDPGFLEALNLVRAGEGKAGVEKLISLGVTFAPTVDTKFEGTTIYGVNENVNRFNDLRLYNLKDAEPYMSRSDRWGDQKGEWKNIPEKLRLKKGALVMVLTNDTEGFSYANGDLGYIRGWSSMLNKFEIELIRTGAIVNIGRIHRQIFTDDEPPAFKGRWDMQSEVPNAPYWIERVKKWAVGGVIYHPIRVGYASTCHKSQGLSLDRVQIDVTHHFMKQPGMTYVALSRARSVQGLRIVGTPEQMIERVKTAEAVRRWL